MSLYQENLYYDCENQQPPEINSIFKYYSVGNEVNFVLKQLKQGVNPESAKRYINNSVYRFLGEFVGKILVDKVDYQMVDGQIMFDGVAKPVEESYKERGQVKGVNSREYAEAVGFEKIEKKFANDEANTAFWLSPPSIGEKGFGNYGFLFILIKDEIGHIDEYILRYENENQNLGKTEKVYEKLISFFPLVKSDKKLVKDTDVNGFLKDPLFAKVTEPEKFLAEIGFWDLSEFKKFQKKLDKEVLFREWLNEYIQVIFDAIQEGNIGKKSILIDEAKKTLAGIYNLARDIKDDCLKLQVKRSVEYPDYSDYQMMMTIKQNYIHKEAVVVGGGSCSVDTEHVKSSFQTGWESILNNNGIINHKSAVELTNNSERYDDYECPHCHAIIQGELKDKPETWHTECPYCKCKFNCKP